MSRVNSNSIISIQDMGAAGLTSSSVEMASKGGLGIEIELDKALVEKHIHHMKWCYLKVKRECLLF